MPRRFQKKEELISDLRKELRVSDLEHRELLLKINSDEAVRMIRLALCLIYLDWYHNCVAIFLVKDIHLFPGNGVIAISANSICNQNL